MTIPCKILYFDPSKDAKSWGTEVFGWRQLHLRPLLSLVTAGSPLEVHSSVRLDSLLLYLDRGMDVGCLVFCSKKPLLTPLRKGGCGSHDGDSSVELPTEYPGSYQGP